MENLSENDIDEEAQGCSQVEEHESSDETCSDDDNDESSARVITIIEQKLSENPYHYQSHIDLITLLRKLGELEKLRNARTKMAKLFPLTQVLWMEWIEDEKKFAESEKEHEHIVELLELAVKDYMCPDIWLEYSQYATRWMNKPDGVTKIRDVLERAIAAAGHHFTDGTCVWDMCREFENIMLLSMQPPPGSVPTAEQSQKIKKQKGKITGLFRGQLSLPLLGMEKTYQEYLSWCEDVDPNIKNCYNQALKKLKELQPFEDALLAAETPKLQEYNNYIEHEIKSGTSSGVQCLYERALVDNCLNSEVWLQYLKYMNEQSSHPKVLVEINLRSVRNCPWIGQLWISYLKALERNKAPKEKLQETFDEALMAGFSTAYEYMQLWLTRCAQIRRMVSTCMCSQEELSKSFQTATKYINETVIPYYNESGDPYYSLWTFWSFCEASICKNIKKAEDILKSLTQTNADARRRLHVWREYYDVIWTFGGEDKIDKCRGILRQAVQHCAILPDPVSGGIPDAEMACELLISFENRHGTMADMDDSMKKIRIKLTRIAKHREKGVASYATETSQRKNAKQRQQAGKKNVHRKRKLSGDKLEQSSANPSKQQKHGDELISVNDGFKAPVFLPIRYVSKAARQTTQLLEKPTSETDPHPSSASSKSAPPPGFKGHEPNTDSTSAADENNNNDVVMKEGSAKDEAAVADKRSIFISNLDFKLENVEQKLKDVFCSCGSIADIRLVKNNKGQFRGFCYIQFSDEIAAEKALKLDRMNMEGRPMFVSPNIDKKKQPNFKVFKYDLGLEKHKLFVSNLSFHTTEDTLYKTFSQHGPLKGVRVVTNRKGQSKGLAYIEYEKESDATLAVMKLDGSKIDDFAVKVAISNPPSRKLGQDKSKSQISKPEQFKGSRGRGRTQLSMMVPRSVVRSDQPETSKSDATTKKCTSGGMTNKDFANLLKK